MLSKKGSIFMADVKKRWGGWPSCLGRRWARKAQYCFALFACQAFFSLRASRCRPCWHRLSCNRSVSSALVSQSQEKTAEAEI